MTEHDTEMCAECLKESMRLHWRDFLPTKEDLAFCIIVGLLTVAISSWLWSYSESHSVHG